MRLQKQAEGIYQFSRDKDRGKAIAIISRGASKVLPELYADGKFDGVIAHCGGAAMTGLGPVVEIMYMDFSMVAMDQLVNQAAKVDRIITFKLK